MTSKLGVVVHNGYWWVSWSQLVLVATLQVLQEELATFGGEHALQRRFEWKEFLWLGAVYWLDRALGHACSWAHNLCEENVWIKNGGCIGCNSVNYERCALLIAKFYVIANSHTWSFAAIHFT